MRSTTARPTVCFGPAALITAIETLDLQALLGTTDPNDSTHLWSSPS